MTAPAADNQPPKKRRPRRQNLAAAGEVFGDFTPWQNPPAVYAYRTSLYGLAPIVGLGLGPAAIVLGLIGRRRFRKNPEVHGMNFANAGITIGTIDVLFNAAGIGCVTRGLGWW
jgi:hypothetical protein